MERKGKTGSEARHRETLERYKQKRHKEADKRIDGLREKFRKQKKGEVIVNR